MIEAQDIGGEAAQAGEDAGVCTDTRPVFVEGDIAQMVVAVFNAPVVADGLACLVCENASNDDPTKTSRKLLYGLDNRRFSGGHVSRDE